MTFQATDLFNQSNTSTQQTNKQWEAQRIMTEFEMTITSDSLIKSLKNSLSSKDSQIASLEESTKSALSSKDGLISSLKNALITKDNQIAVLEDFFKESLSIKDSQIAAQEEAEKNLKKSIASYLNALTTINLSSQDYEAKLNYLARQLMLMGED